MIQSEWKKDLCQEYKKFIEHCKSLLEMGEVLSFMSLGVLLVRKLEHFVSFAYYFHLKFHIRRVENISFNIGKRYNFDL